MTAPEKVRRHELSAAGIVSEGARLKCCVWLCGVAGGRCDGSWGHAGYWHTCRGQEYEATFDGQAEHALRQKAIADAETVARLGNPTARDTGKSLKVLAAIQRRLEQWLRFEHFESVYESDDKTLMPVVRVVVESSETFPGDA